MQNKRNINSFGITLNRYCMLQHVLGEGGGTICYIRYSGRGGGGRELYVTTGTLGRRRVRYSGEGALYATTTLTNRQQRKFHFTFVHYPQ